MKLGTTLILCAASAIGTAVVLDKATNGMVTETLFNRNDDFEDEDDNIYFNEVDIENDGICALTKADAEEDSPHDHVFMPIQDALNLYDMIEEAIGKIDPIDQSGIKCFGDKAISFERLYDAIEKDITSRYSDKESIENPFDNVDESHNS